MIASLFLSVAIVAHEPGYYTSLANHVGRWLKDQDIAAEVVKPAEMRTKLAKEKVAFLVGFESPSADEIFPRQGRQARRLLFRIAAARRVAGRPPGGLQGGFLSRAVEPNEFHRCRAAGSAERDSPDFDRPAAGSPDKGKVAGDGYMGRQEWEVYW